MGKGKATYLAVLGDPTETSIYLADFEPEQAFYYLSVFRFEILVYQARKFRLAMQISTIMWGNGLPGFLKLIPFLCQQFTHIGQGNLPILHRNPVNGEWLVMEKQAESTLLNSKKEVPLYP
jgi:hypothetical protein